MPLPLALIPALFQAGVGIAQQMDAKDAAKNNVRPEYKTPQELLSALSLSKSQFSDPRFAGQAQLEASVGQNLSQSLEAAQSRGNGMTQVAGIAAAGNQANQDIAAEQARQQQNDLGNYQNMLKIIAGSKDQEWQLNKFAPYSDKYNEMREMKGAGQQNLFSALDSMAAITGRFSSAAAGNQPVNIPAVASSAAAANQTSQQQSQYVDVLLAKQMTQWANMANQASGMRYGQNQYSPQESNRPFNNFFSDQDTY